MNVSNKTLLAAAMGGLLLATTVNLASAGEATPPAAAGDKTGECHGINACKGTGACGGAGHSCAGKNSCKGKGWLSLTKADCESKGGTFKE